MSLLLVAPNRDMKPWKKALLKEDANLDIEIWPDVENRERIQFAVCWNHPRQVLDKFPNLKTISSLGAGVDHILKDGYLPNNVSVCRVVCPSLVRQMKEYVLNVILNYQRNTKRYIEQQQNSIWKVHPNKSPEEFTVGIMGLGELGKPTALLLSRLGYTVRGWASSKKNMEEIESFSGREELVNFLSGTNILVCMLPLTSKTEEILSLDLFKILNRPGYLINVGRGEHLVEEDLIYALDKNWMDGATLDVFCEEPLPEKHPFWNRDRITITPHVSSLTSPEEAAGQIAENYKRTLSGMEPLYKVDREKGY